MAFTHEKNIKQFDSKVWHSSPTMHGDELKWMSNAYSKNWMSSVGENINEVEAIVARKIGCKYAVALSAGTASLHLAMMLVGIKRISEAIEMKGNPFFIQRWPGRRKKLIKKQCKKHGVTLGKYVEEKIIKPIKFRTMTQLKYSDVNFLSDELRLNKYWNLLRSTSLDELPSLLNIVKGNISIVSLRSLVIKYMPLYSKAQRHRHDLEDKVKLDTDIEKHGYKFEDGM